MRAFFPSSLATSEFGSRLRHPKLGSFFSSFWVRFQNTPCVFNNILASFVLFLCCFGVMLPGSLASLPGRETNRDLGEPAAFRPAARRSRSAVGVQGPRQRSAHLPICLPALAFALLDFSTALGGRNHRQGLRTKAEEDFLAWLNRQGLTPAQPHKTIVAYVDPFVKRKMRGDKKSGGSTGPAGGCPPEERNPRTLSHSRVCARSHVLRRALNLPHGVYFQHLVAVVVDDLYGDFAGLGRIEWAADG